MSADGAGGIEVAFTSTTCPYCGVGCGVKARALPDGRAEITGDKEHPANFGRLCSKGSALGETVSLDGRLLHPTFRDNGVDQRASWDEALDRIADGFRKIVDEHGPDAVAFYVSGQLLTEDYYVANKLMKGWIGSANIDTNSRLCMSSAVAGHIRAFGEDIVPCSYEDLETCELLVLVGSNLAWCHPVLYQRIVAARERRPSMKIVVIDPRRTSTCDIADLHLPLKAGRDVALFNGLLAHLHQAGALAKRFVAGKTEGLEAALAAAGEADLQATAAECGLDPNLLLRFYGLYTNKNKVVTAFSMGVNQSGAGTDKVNAIINCHLLTGRIGRPGMGPFSITGQPNAMGGREVGGLANMLAAHMKLEEPAHRALVQRFWKSPRIADKPGLKAVELFERVRSGYVKAIWIMATNPVVSLPDADAVKAALAACPLVVVSDVIPDTDTAKYAHVLLPAAAWGEKDGTVTNTERRISRQRPFLPLPGEARPDWWALAEVGKRMGYGEGFNWATVGEVFDEHARLTAHGNAPGATTPTNVHRVLNLEALAGLKPDQYETLQPLQWPTTTAQPLASKAIGFPLARLRFVATAPRAPANAPDAEYPLVLNTGRVRDHWHTMTRTGRAPRLAAHTAAPFVQIHADTAASTGIADGQLALVETRWGHATLRARVTADVAPGGVFVPIHWNDATASDARVGALVNPVVDPISGEPEFKHTPARVSARAMAWYGALLVRGTPRLATTDWWARAAGEQHARYELAGAAAPEDWTAFARELLGGVDGSAGGGTWIDAADPAKGSYRAAWLRDGRIEASLYIARTPALPSIEWVAKLFAVETLSPAERAALLAGRPAGGADAGPLVCSCFGVCRNTILAAIKANKLKNPKQIGQQLKAGTNCGSCVPELKGLLALSAAT